MEIYSLPEVELQKLIIHASGEGRADVIAKVLQANSRLRSCVDEEGLGPLHHAVLRSQVDAVRSLLRAGVPADTKAISGDHAGKTARQLADSDASTNATIRGAFSAELLQSVMLGNVERTADLLRAGVGPLEPIGPGADSPSLIAYAEDLCTDDSNPAVDYLRSYARQESKEATAVEEIESSPSPEPEALEASNTSEPNVPPSSQAPPASPPRSSDASPAAISGKSPRADVDAKQLLAKQLEEKDALIDRLRSMLSDMAEEQEVLRRLAYQQGGTSLADHFRRLKRSLADASDDLAAKSAEAEAQEQQLQELRAQLNAEAARHRKAVARACTLAQELEAAKAAVHRVDAATQLDSAALSTDQGIALEKSKPAATAASRANTANNRSRANGAEAEQPVAGGAAAAVAAADAALQLPIYSTHNSSSSSSRRSAPQSAEPWRDPFGGDYAATSPEDQHADEANGSSGNNRQERDSSWWPFQGKSPQKVGGRLVLQV